MLPKNDCLLTKNGWATIDALRKVNPKEIRDENNSLQQVEVRRCSRQDIYRITAAGGQTLFATKEQVIKLADNTSIVAGDLVGSCNKRIKLYIPWREKYSITFAEEGAVGGKGVNWNFPKDFLQWKTDEQTSYIAGLAPRCVSIVGTSVEKQAHGYLLFSLPENSQVALRMVLRSIWIKPLTSIHTVGERKYHYTKINSLASLMRYAHLIGFYNSEGKRERFQWLMERKMPVVKDARYVRSERVFEVKTLGECKWFPVNGIICHDNSEES